MALAARWMATRSVAEELAEINFEEQSRDAIQKIGLEPGAARAAGI